MEATQKGEQMGDTISRQVAIDAVDKSRRLNHHQDKKMARAHEYEHRHFLKILGDLPSAQPERNGWVHIDDIYRLISSHSNYHGDNILAALTCLAEGKEVLKSITVLDTQSERKTGKWIDNTYCSECGWVNQVEPGFVGPVKGFNFCPNCGADMRGERK